MFDNFGFVLKSNYMFIEYLRDLSDELGGFLEQMDEIPAESEEVVFDSRKSNDGY